MTETLDECEDICIIGGGIAAVSCVQSLLQLHPSSTSAIHVIAPSDAHFEARARRLTRRTSLVDLQPVKLSSLSPRIRMHIALANFVNTQSKTVVLSNGSEIRYGSLLLAAGAVPRQLPLPPNPHVITIRDHNSVMNLAAALQKKPGGEDRLRVVLVGGGGIAMELAQHSVLQNCDVVWIVKEDILGKNYLDDVAASVLLHRPQPDKNCCLYTDSRSFEWMGAPVLRIPQEALKPFGGLGGSNLFTPSQFESVRIDSYCSKPSACYEKQKDCSFDAAMGPLWLHSLVEHSDFIDQGSPIKSACIKRIIMNCEVVNVMQPPPSSTFNVSISLSNQEIMSAHVVIVAIGVVPSLNREFFKGEIIPDFADDGGIIVDSRMQSSVECIFAAGDCCSLKQTHSLHWFQMRLWAQAAVMGAAAARSMLARQLGPVEDMEAQAPYELFTHVATFMGWRVTMLGLYNGQGLAATDCEAIIRVSKGVEYAKLLLSNGRVQGALFASKTDGVHDVETYENLILSQIYVGEWGEELLEGRVDVADFFD